MTRAEAEALCLLNAARVVEESAWGPVAVVADQNAALVFDVAQETAARLRAWADAALDSAPVQLDLFAEVLR